MKVTVNHIFGNTTDYDIQGYRLELDLQGAAEIDAVEKGWSIYGNQWVLLRSVRLRTADYTKQPKQIPNHTFVHKDHSEVDLVEIRTVFDQFVAKRQFTPQYSVDIDLDRTSWLCCYNDNNLVAFTKFIHYKGALESQFTAWNYHQPKLSIGKKIIDYEIAFAKLLKLPHLYIGDGCTETAIYKSTLNGFEFWDNGRWSSDKDKYIELCKRDSSVKTLQDLSNILHEAAKSP